MNVFGNSNSNNNKFDTSLYVQKPFLRTSFLESNLEEDIHLKNEYRIKKLPDPVSIREGASRKYVDNKFIDPCLKKHRSC